MPTKKTMTREIHNSHDHENISTPIQKKLRQIMEMTLRKSLKADDSLIVSPSPIFALAGMVFSLFAWRALYLVLLSSPSEEEYWSHLVYALGGSIFFPIAVVQIITIKTIFTPSKIFDKRLFKRTVEKQISDIDCLKKLDGNGLCMIFVDGSKITIHWPVRNFSKIPAFISKHTNGRVEIIKS